MSSMFKLSFETRGPWVDPAGVTGGSEYPPPDKSQSHRVSYQYWSGSHSYQGSIQCWGIIVPSKTPFKCRFTGGAMMTRLKWYLEPLSSHQIKRLVKIGHPLSKLSGSAHEAYINAWACIYVPTVWASREGYCEPMWISRFVWVASARTL